MQDLSFSNGTQEDDKERMVAYLTFTMDVPLCFLDSVIATMIFMLDASFGPQLLSYPILQDPCGEGPLWGRTPVGDTSATLQYELLSYQLRHPLINLVN